ncbi:MAG: cobalamin-binding protein [Bacteroidota bacterium]
MLLLLLLTQLTACNRPSHETPKAVRSVTDDLGRSVGVDRTPLRIVSLAPSLTEMLFVLGAGDKVVGVTSYCNYPPETAGKTVVGDLVTPDIERIFSLEPDLVFISVEGNSQRTFVALERLGVRLFVSNPRDIQGVYKSMRDIGKLLKIDARASTVVDSLKAEEARLRKSRVPAGKSVLMLLSLQPLMAAGSDTFIDEVISLAGGSNAATGLKGSYPILNREMLLRINPDLVLYPDDMGMDEMQLCTGYPEWRKLRAMNRGAVYRIDADVFLRPGPRVFLAAAQLRTYLEK